MAQPTGRPRGRPPGSKNRSTLERERKEKEKMLSESRDEIVNEVVKKVEKMVDNKMDVTTPPKGDKGIVLGGFAGTYQKVAQKGQFSLLKSEQFGDRAYMVLLKGKKVVAKDIATMNDARVVKAIGRAHKRADAGISGDAGKVSKGGVVEDIVMDLALITEEIDNQITRIKDISGDADIMNVWDMLESANRLILNASNELESLGIEKSKKGKVRKSRIGKDTSARNGSEARVVMSVYEDLEELLANLRDCRLPARATYLRDKWRDGFGDITVPLLLESAMGKYDEMYENLVDARQEAYRFYEGQMAWSPTTGDEGNWVNKSGKSGPSDHTVNKGRRENLAQMSVILRQMRDLAHSLVSLDADYDTYNTEELLEDIDNMIYWLERERDDPAVKSKKGSQSKAPVKDDRGSIGIDIETMIRTRKESKEKPETDVDEPIETPDEPPVTQGEKPKTDPDEPIEAPSEPAVSDNGKDDDISSLESSAGPTVIANSNDGPKLDIDIDLDDDEDLEKMMARKERMQSQAEPPGRTQPFSNNYRTIQMGAGKFNPMDMPKGKNVKP